MKKMILFTSLVMSSTTFAGTYVYHDWDGALRGIALNNACITDGEVNTIRPMKVCTKYVQKPVQDEGGIRYETVCVATAMLDRTFSRTFDRTVCTKWAYEADGNLICKKWGTVTQTLPATIKIATVTEHGDYSNWPGVTSYFTFPTCN